MNEETTGKCLRQMEHMVTQIFHNGQPSHGGDRKTFGLSSFLVSSNPLSRKSW